MPSFEVRFQIDHVALTRAIKTHLGLNGVDIEMSHHAEHLGEMLYANLAKTFPQLKATFRSSLWNVATPLRERKLYIEISGDNVAGVTECIKEFQAMFD